ncbi:PAS domain S-box protein [Deltaproteobacteria bacterium]|nr:PAS domain S-box protein [Deltaproteobacteria bacterium]
MVVAWTEQIFEDIVETIREPLLVLDSDLKVILANQSFYDSFKVKPEETVGQLIYDLGNKQWDIPKLRELLETILPEKTSFDDYEVEHDFATIGRRVMLLNARQIERAIGKERIILLAIEDVTERAQLETSLKDSEERFRRLFETADDGILLLDKKELKISHANPAITAMLDYSNKELIGKGFEDIGFADNFGDFQEIMQALNKDGIIRYPDIPIQKKTGQVVETDVYMVDRAKLVQCNIRDITERKKLTEDLLTLQKLEAVGILAGGIAHDFNNILTAIIGNISLAKMHMSPDNEIFDLLNESEIASIRAQTLTRQLLTFAKGGMPLKETASIRDLLKASASFVMRGSISDIKFSIADDLWMAEVDIGQISQVINNLIINANQAMIKKGIIQVAAENLMIDNGQGFPIEQGRYIRISIKDQGVGIAKDNLLKLFDPYFTTKKEGSGLGLATTYSIIQKHNGHITVESQLGVGTTFYVYLPASDKIFTEKKEVTLIKGPGRILVMDDEAPLQKLIGRMLENLGYESEFAKDGAEAIRMVKDAKEAETPYDAAILDLTIPGKMGGKEAINKLLEIDPELKAIVFSGYSDDPVMANFKEYGFKGMMPKPFESLSLGKVLHEVLRGEKE